MPMQLARKRTESMVERFAKKPISEGFELWDRDYPLGALRLFTFKSETALPFHLGPCLDAIAEISLQMNGLEDAREHFGLAADKYQLIQQPILAELMRIKALEIASGPREALSKLQAYIKQVDPEHNGGGSEATVKTKSSLARCYAYEAELLLGTTTEEEEASVAPRAVEAAKRAVELGWDRVHTGYCVLGDAYEAAGDLDKAKEAYDAAIHQCPRCLTAMEQHIRLAKALGANPADLLPLLNQAIEVHPRAALIREKAFLLSETQGDAAALEFLDKHLQSPPQEETESVSNPSGPTVATLLKAKAAILADAGKLPEALEAAKSAAAADAEDEEAAAIIAEIEASQGAAA